MIVRTPDQYIHILDSHDTFSHFTFGENKFVCLTECVALQSARFGVEDMTLFQFDDKLSVTDIIRKELPPFYLLEVGDLAVVQNNLCFLYDNSRDYYSVKYCNYDTGEITECLFSPEQLRKYSLDYVLLDLQILHNTTQGFLAMACQSNFLHVFSCSIKGLYYFDYLYGLDALDYHISRLQSYGFPLLNTLFNEPFCYDPGTNCFEFLSLICYGDPSDEMLWYYFTFDPVTGIWTKYEALSSAVPLEPPDYDEFTLKRSNAPSINYLANRDMLAGIIYLPEVESLVFFKMDKKLKQIRYNLFRHTTSIPVIPHYTHSLCNFFISPKSRVYYLDPGPRFQLKYHYEKPSVLVLDPEDMRKLIDIPLPYRAELSQVASQGPTTTIQLRL